MHHDWTGKSAHACMCAGAFSLCPTAHSALQCPYFALCCSPSEQHWCLAIACMQLRRLSSIRQGSLCSQGCVVCFVVWLYQNESHCGLSLVSRIRTDCIFDTLMHRFKCMQSGWSACNCLLCDCLQARLHAPSLFQVMASHVEDFAVKPWLFFQASICI